MLPLRLLKIGHPGLSQFTISYVSKRLMSNGKILFPIIRLPEHLISTVLFARQNTSYTHTLMEMSFRPSLTLVPSLANYSLSLNTPPPPPHWGVPLSPHLSLHSTFWRSRENISLYRCFCTFAHFPYGLQFTGFTYDSSLSNCVIVTYLYMPILYLLKRSDSFTFLSEFRGGGVYLVYGSSLPPTWPLVFFSDE